MYQYGEPSSTLPPQHPSQPSEAVTTELTTHTTSTLSCAARLECLACEAQLSVAWSASVESDLDKDDAPDGIPSGCICWTSFPTSSFQHTCCGRNCSRCRPRAPPPRHELPTPGTTTFAGLLLVSTTAMLRHQERVLLGAYGGGGVVSEGGEGATGGGTHRCFTHGGRLQPHSPELIAANYARIAALRRKARNAGAQEPQRSALVPLPRLTTPLGTALAPRRRRPPPSSSAPPSAPPSAPSVGMQTLGAGRGERGDRNAALGLVTARPPPEAEAEAGASAVDRHLEELREVAAGPGVARWEDAAVADAARPDAVANAATTDAAAAADAAADATAVPESNAGASTAAGLAQLESGAGAIGSFDSNFAELCGVLAAAPAPAGAHTGARRLPPLPWPIGGADAARAQLGKEGSAAE